MDLRAATREKLRQISKWALAELRSMPNPSECIKDVAACVAFFNPTGFEMHHKSIISLVSRHYIAEDTQSAARCVGQQMLWELTLLQDLTEYDIDKMTPQMYRQVQNVIDSYDPPLDVARVKKNSCAAGALFQWVATMMHFGKVYHHFDSRKRDLRFSETQQMSEREKTENAITTFERRLKKLNHRKPVGWVPPRARPKIRVRSKTPQHRGYEKRMSMKYAWTI